MCALPQHSLGGHRTALEPALLAGCDQSLWANRSAEADADPGGVVMKPLLWIAVPMFLLAAGMLIAGVGEAGLWIAVVAVGVAFVAIDVFRSRHA
jgi:hypothetical protein